MVLIQPEIGSFFDPRLHDAYDEEGMQQYPEKHSKKKILWILRRGFKYKEDGVDGPPRVLTIKALVVVQ